MQALLERRARLVTRQLTAVSAVGAARAVVALHATDPATLYLSVLTRCPELTVDDVTREMYDERRMIRMLAMRRTLFAVPVELVPVVHAAASIEVAARQRRRLLAQLDTIPTDPVLPDDRAAWLSNVEGGVTEAIARLGAASGSQLARAEPRLRTTLLPTTDKPYDVRRAITTHVLTLMGAEGQLVRGRPLGSWTSRQHMWEPVGRWWPDGIPSIDLGAARSRLVEQYLRRFGPATEADLVWWTGWSKSTARNVLATLDVVDWCGGLVLAEDVDETDDPDPTATLLPALDATPMGWKQREWFLPEDASPLYDAYGNIGPTVWWGGEVVGGWAVRPDASIATQLVRDRGAHARHAVADAAGQLASRLAGTVVVPTFRTPLERDLASR